MMPDEQTRARDEACSLILRASQSAYVDIPSDVVTLIVDVIALVRGDERNRIADAVAAHEAGHQDLASYFLSAKIRRGGDIDD